MPVIIFPELMIVFFKNEECVLQMIILTSGQKKMATYILKYERGNGMAGEKCGR
jgi:hypothetical protein